MSEGFDREEFVTGYLGEAEEHLQAAGSCLLRLEAAPGESQPRQIRELFRSLHTLKGLSAMVGVEPIVAIAHEMETILRQADQAARPLTANAIELLLSGLKAIEQRLRAFAKRETVAPAPTDLVWALNQLARASNTSGGAASLALSLPPGLLAKLTRSEQEQLDQGIAGGLRGLRIDFTPSPAKAERGVSITTVRERLGKIAEIVKVVPGSVPKTPEAPGGLVFSLIVLTSAQDAQLAEAADADAAALVPIGREPQPEYVDVAADDGGEALSSASTIRVNVSRLDDALESLSALVVGRFRLSGAAARLREQGSDVRELSQLLDEHARELRRLRATLTRARMLPVAQLLERVPLLVRGMSKSAGKQVRLSIDAGRAELDKGVAERIFPAILHLVRNAVDHAIEPPAERIRLGKPREGLVSIRCFERSDNRLELTVSDDGAGIDRERVARKAGAPLPHDDAALLELIARPGLSTQDEANSRSGRGMGMDIVRRVTVDTLGGELRLRSERNAGTTFTLRIPLSISIMDSFSLLCSAQTFVVPLASIEEIVELSPARIAHAPSPGRSRVEVSLLRQRDAEIPLVSLSAVFGLAESATTSAVVVRREQQRFAFAVDRMLTQQEAVIRPLEDPLVRVPGVSGTTDLGNGQPTLVLDLMSLVSGLPARLQGVSP
jgi:two-component system, chemotaxis family, sensor kinase CheA